MMYINETVLTTGFAAGNAACCMHLPITGEQWDDMVHMDTYYNPIPHFGFKLALDHSPQLRNVPLKPKEIKQDDPFGPGLDQL
jgi:hypothetical protein